MRRSFLEEEDSDDREVRGRRVSQRHQKRMKYCDEEEEVVDKNDEDEDTEEDDELPGTSLSFNQKAQETSKSLQNLQVLLVTCENKKGTLHKEKFEKGELCIECEGQWFSPSGFENFCGRGASKKWKISVFYKKMPLQFWIEKGLLNTKGFKRRAPLKRKMSSSGSLSDCSSREDEGQPAEESGKEDSGDEDCVPDSEEPMLENENKQPGAENAGGDSPEDEAADDGHESGEWGKKMSKMEEMGQTLKGEPKVVLERLSVAKQDPQSFSMRDSISEGSWQGPMDGDTQKEAERELITPTQEDSPETAAETPPLTLQIPVSVLIMDHGDTQEESAESETTIQDGQWDIKTEPVNSLPQPADYSETLQETETGGSIPGPSTSCDLDMMDLEQLKREKVKMQLKVLKLQEEYYTFKIREHKKKL